jgi:hypothetical protein
VSTNRRGAAALLAGTVLVLGMATPLSAQMADTTPPDTTITSGPSGQVTDPSASFTFTASEGGVTFQCSLDGQAYAPCTSPQHYTDLRDGTHHFDVRAVDAAGNADETPAERDWTVSRPDTTPPNTTITSGPSGTVEESQATFHFSSDEGDVTFECAKDTGAFLACESPKTYYGFTDGLHSFRVRAIDKAGNPDPTPASREWTVRRPVTTTQPTTATTSPPSTNTTAPPATTSTTPAHPAPSGGGGANASQSPGKGTPTTAKPTTTTAKPAKGAGTAKPSTSTTEAAPPPPAPAPVGDLPGALVLTGPAATGDFQAAAPDGDAPVVGEVNKRPARDTKVLIGMAAAAGLLLLGTAAVLWWRRPGRYIPA